MLAECIEKPLTVIPEHHQSHLRFNVMADRSVVETLSVHEYRVGDRYAEAHFERSYSSAMAHSPSHLIFLSVQIHAQKLLYMALCREFGFEYDPHGPERFKMWPTKLDVRIPRRIDQEQGLVQQLWIKDVRKVRDGQYRVCIETRVDTLTIAAQVPTFIV